MKTNVRDVSLDITRILALFLVIVVHTYKGDLSVANFLELGFFFIGKLGVPLFVMISGALLLNKNVLMETFYQKRAVRVLLPWVFWSIIYFLVEYVVITSIQNQPQLLLKNFLTIMLSDFWFMPMILGLYWLTPYLKKMSLSVTNWQPLFWGWVALVSVLPLVYLSPLFPGSSSAGLLTLICSFIGYYIAGWYLWHAHTRHHSFKPLLLLLLSSAVMYVVLSDNTSHLEHLSFFALHDYFSLPIIIGSLSTLLLLKQLKKMHVTQPSDTARMIATYSFGIFLCHPLLLIGLEYLLPPSFSTNALHWWIFRAFLLYSVSGLLIHSLYQVPMLKKLVT